MSAAVKGLVTVGGPLAPGNTFTVEGGDLGALLEWRPRAGEAFTVVDGGGRLLRARLTSLGDGGASLTVFEETGFSLRPSPAVTLLQALPMRERMELVMEKAVELGVARIVPFESVRSITLAERDGRQRKSHRWWDLVLRAARQSRRPDLPSLERCTDFEGALALAAPSSLKLLLTQGCGPEPINRVVDGAAGRLAAADATVAVLVGPEGGLDPGEIDAARAAGFLEVSLGRNVLRTETAAIAALSVLACRFDDL
ncbi:MAG TPA: 16S rRNA (uracil(1498)-N(3))-methyltransferase [Deltaproteobacteria bacterium]|nr:16S rRNA (uracil(1498)-N(3))-methyltransferase [Deltaproteobacteria bacterium]